MKKENRIRIKAVTIGFVATMTATYVVWFLIGLIPWFITLDSSYINDVIHYMFNVPESGNYFRMALLGGIFGGFIGFVGNEM